MSNDRLDVQYLFAPEAPLWARKAVARKIVEESFSVKPFDELEIRVKGGPSKYLDGVDIDCEKDLDGLYATIQKVLEDENAFDKADLTIVFFNSDSYDSLGMVDTPSDFSYEELHKCHALVNLDIRNSRNLRFPSEAKQYMLERILLHEAGHFFGCENHCSGIGCVLRFNSGRDNARGMKYCSDHREKIRDTIETYLESRKKA